MKTFLSRPAEQVAPDLIGCLLEREIDGKIIQVRIVETEAYDESDAASHSYKGKTPRTESMFGGPGHLYVYFTYGMHYCCNVVTDAKGKGSAVLIRAVEPVSGKELMEELRGRNGLEVSNGPAKLCQALGIDKRLDGHDLTKLPLKLIIKPRDDSTEVIQTKRIGIAQAKDVPWRFYMSGNDYVSRTRN